MDNKLHDWQQEMIDDHSDDPRYQHQLRCEFEADNEYERGQQKLTDEIREVNNRINDISTKIVKSGGSQFLVYQLIELVEKRCKLNTKKNTMTNSSSYYR